MPALRHLLSLLFIVGILQGAVPEPPFRVGVAPHTSARFILEKYQPLRRHLETALGRNVEIVTAPDFTEFARQGLSQSYDLAITTGHQAWLLVADAGYLPLLTYQAEFRAVVIVSKRGGVSGAKQLKGTTVIGLSSSSLVTLWGQHWLKRVGLAEVPVRYVSAADSVAQLLLAGEGSAGFLSLANFQNLPPQVREQFRILAQSPAMAGRVYVLNRRNRALGDSIWEALWTFAGSEEGHRYFASNQLEGYRKLRRGELEAMEPYAEEVRGNLRGN